MKEIERKVKERKQMIEKIIDNILKDNYVIIPREKNRMFRRRYNLTTSDVKKILLNISMDNFVKEEFDNDTLKYGEGSVLIFIIQSKLKNYYSFVVEVKIYVKIKYSEEFIPVISLHESEVK